MLKYKYPTLRLRLHWEEELLQIIDKKGNLDWRYIDLTKIKDTKKQNLEIKKIQKNDRKIKYDLEKDNLFRVYIIKQKHDLYTCIFSNHHAILDGWSMPILLKYIHDTYLNLLNNKTINISRDQSYLYAQKYIQNTYSDNQEYWKDQVNKIEEYLNLSNLIYDKSLAHSLSEYRHIKHPKTKSITIKEDLYRNLKELSKIKGITLNAILQYVWHKVLAIYGTNNDNNNSITVVGTTVSGRDLPIHDLESSVGLYINTLPLVVEHKK